MFTFKETDEDGIKHFVSEDGEFEVLQQENDGFFLLYRFNEKENFFDWTETKHTSLEECEVETKSLLAS
ncbi:hypothetical protein JMA_38190 (plasmid) [Jeotgalibacillus malaysiensis]|uniref:Uncharacterized protein n=1 Tax=Jeotgalibacillus malaysiensis TaxID=1508404 RepID=A0A0B5AWQ7_9BACL|nr:hypothetical protein [Jeotgalibacillus malaysiensis]AJD93137.1 hypothetical protein JMA_38190 [Jeotgalibacillus malaysiensis]